MTMMKKKKLLSELSILALLILWDSAFAGAVNLTPENYDKLTKGKTVFVRFFASWCDHSKKMAPAWEKLAKEWEDKPGLVADIDCTGAGRPLCKKHGVSGFPTLKYGDPADLEEYDGGRSYEDLIIFAAEYLKPPCSPLNTDLCDAEMKKVIDDYKAMDTSELLDLVDQEEEKLTDVVAKYEKEVEKLQQAYEQLTKEKEDAIEAARGEGLDLLKPVIAFKKKIEAARLGKDEL